MNMSIIYPHFDAYLIKYLNIDDLRRLYRINTYYRNLCKDRLANFIEFYAKINTIQLPQKVKFKMLFKKTIMFGKLNVCQYVQQKYNIRVNDEAFQLCCAYDRIDIIKWLYSLGNINVHAERDFAFRLSCAYGHFDIVKWLYSLGNIDIRQF